MKTKTLLLLLAMMLAQVVVAEKLPDNYYFDHFGTDSCHAVFVEESVMYAKIDSLHIQRTIVNGKTILTKNGFRCALTDDLLLELMHNDVSCIQRMSQSVDAWLVLLSSAKAATLRTGKYLKLYRSELLQSSDMGPWKLATARLNTILTKMRKLPYANSPAYGWQVSSETVELHVGLLTILECCQQLLGE